jgi:hypothetical protein
MRRLALLAILALTVGADCEPREQTCLRDNECLEPTQGFGRCVEAHCALYDSRCPSSYRWDDAAGPARRDRCVPSEVLPDAGGLDAL